MLQVNINILVTTTKNSELNKSIRKYFIRLHKIVKEKIYCPFITVANCRSQIYLNRSDYIFAYPLQKL